MQHRIRAVISTKVISWREKDTGWTALTHSKIHLDEIFRPDLKASDDYYTTAEEALELIGFYDSRHEPDAKVFPDFKDKMTGTTLKNWLKAAGITKHITFHCTRHTFGSLQVEAGTSVYTVQHMLGHKNVATTQIYAEMADESKRESVDRITLKPGPVLRAVKTGTGE